MVVMSYPFLCDEAQRIREIVFMQEQGFKQEFDEFDERALHLVMFSDENEAIATCRIFKAEMSQTYILGRLAVLKEYRRNGVGATLIAEAEKEVRKKGGRVIALHAQCQAQVFYAKAGYSAYGEIDDEEGCLHIWMRKMLFVSEEYVGLAKQA